MNKLLVTTAIAAVITGGALSGAAPAAMRLGCRLVLLGSVQLAARCARAATARPASAADRSATRPTAVPTCRSRATGQDRRAEQSLRHGLPRSNSRRIMKKLPGAHHVVMAIDNRDGPSWPRVTLGCHTRSSPS